MQNQNQETYALGYTKNGNAGLADVMIGDRFIRDQAKFMLFKIFNI